MYLKSNLSCQYLKGSPEGARCSVVDMHIRSMEDADLWLCMNRHYESCSIYARLLLKEAIKRISPDAVPGMP